MSEHVGEKLGGQMESKNNTDTTNTANIGKDIAGMLRLGLVLCAYAVASCFVLALVNYWTLPVITANKLLTAQKAMKAVFPLAEDFSPAEVSDADISAAKALGVTLTNIYKVLEGGEVVGAVGEAEGATYDRAKIMIGLKADGTTTKIEFLELTDSPGFGQKAKDPGYRVPSGKTFFDQFDGLDSAKGFALKNAGAGVIDAISGATITSSGVSKIVTVAAGVLRDVLGLEDAETLGGASMP